MKTVCEVSRISGVSVRALHHYDAIGLLKPTQLTDAGYRMYDDKALERLQTILIFRELNFPLDEIREIIDSPSFSVDEALRRQIELLKLQIEHLGELVSFADRIIKTGEKNMSFSAFDKKKIEEYSKKAKENWGETDAYKEYEMKNADKSTDEAITTAEKMMLIFKEFGSMRNLEHSDAKVQAQVGKLKSFISDNYYNCTTAILRGLGQMYAAGGEMTDNIDRAGGEGTAVFCGRAIEIYCDNN